MRSKTSHAFTIVEMLVVISVVAIISALAVIAFNSVQQESRDGTRQSNATIISEALEKYYEKNGEYPSIVSIVNSNATNTGQVVASKLQIPATSLINPKTPSTITNVLTSNPNQEGDLLAYVSDDTNPQCQNDISGGCDSYTLQFTEEASGEVKKVESRHSTRSHTDAPTLSTSTSTITSIAVSWTEVPSAISYTLERSLSDTMVSPVPSGHFTTSAIEEGLAPGTTYFFRVKAVLPSGTTEWSEVVSNATSSIPAPTGTLTIAASMSGTNARGTATGGSCSSGGTIERQIRYETTSTATAGAWNAYATGTPLDVAANQGWRYTFQQRARCILSGVGSGWTTSATASIVRPITFVPIVPTTTIVPTSTNITWNWTASSCPTGTNPQYRTQRTADWGYDSGLSAAFTTNSYVWNSASQGYEFITKVQAQCITVHSSGGWSASSAGGSYIRPITTPGAPTNFQFGPRSAVDNYEIAWTKPLCGPGTRAGAYNSITYDDTAWKPAPPYWPPDDYIGDSVGFGFSGTSNGGTGQKIGIQMRYKCLNTVTGRVSALGPLGVSPIYTIP